MLSGDVRIASDTIDAGRVAAPPLARCLPHSMVIPLGTALYHGGGLYPLGLKSLPVFLLPSVLSPTGWCRRPLTLAETWGVYDVPHRVVDRLPSMPEVKAAWHASRRLFPGRCLEHGVCQLLAQLEEGRVEGGRIIFSCGMRKRQREEIERPSIKDIEEGSLKSSRHVRKEWASVHDYGKDTRAVSEMKMAPYPCVLKRPALTPIPQEHDCYVAELERLACRAFN